MDYPMPSTVPGTTLLVSRNGEESPFLPGFYGQAVFQSPTEDLQSRVQGLRSTSKRDASGLVIVVFKFGCPSEQQLDYITHHDTSPIKVTRISNSKATVFSSFVCVFSELQLPKGHRRILPRPDVSIPYTSTPKFSISQVGWFVVKDRVFSLPVLPTPGRRPSFRPSLRFVVAYVIWLYLK